MAQNGKPHKAMEPTVKDLINDLAQFARLSPSGMQTRLAFIADGVQTPGCELYGAYKDNKDPVIVFEFKKPRLKLEE